MKAEKIFPICDVLSVATGRLMGGIGGVYEVLNWMTGESLMTHQIPRVSREALPVLLARHPSLIDAVAEACNVTTANYATWLETWTDRYGAEIAVPTMDADAHERIDPMSELVEMVHPDKIITVQP